MASRLNRSELPAKTLKALDEIQEFLSDSLWKEISINLYDGIFCVAKSGNTPSPPPARDEQPTDNKERIRTKRKAAASAERNAKRAKKLKHKEKSLEEIVAALRRVQTIPAQTIPAQHSEPNTYSNLLLKASNAEINDALWRYHLFGKKLRQDEANNPAKSITGRMRAVAEQFRAELPHISEKDRANYLRYGRRIYDATIFLEPNQVQRIQGITMWDLTRLSQVKVKQLLKSCQ